MPTPGQGLTREAGPRLRVERENIVWLDPQRYRLSWGRWFSSLGARNFGGARRAVNHLMGCGHTRIGFLGDLRRIYTAAERYRGYIEALTAGSIEVDENLIRRDVHSQQSAEQATRDLLGSHPAPTAIFTAQNLLTIGARTALRSMGAERIIAHVGFDDIPLAELVDPGITVIAQDPPALGTLAAQMLLHRRRDPSGAPETVEVPTRLIPRGSGEIPVTGQPE
jgi:LacI family transcriptional regulator